MALIDTIQSKRKKHKKYISWLHKTYSKDVLLNRTLDIVELKETSGVDPFEFVVSIDDNPGVEPISVDINSVSKEADQFEHAGGKTTCTIDAVVSLETFVLIIKVKGTPGVKTTFNVTCDGKKVYPQDQELKIDNTGKGVFEDLKAPLPS